MRKIFFVFLSLFLLSATAYATGFNVAKEAGDITVKFSTGRETPVVGKNNITLEFLDAKGVPITDAEVELDYFMPSMPAMKYKADAIQMGSVYTAVLGLAMAGQWDVDVSFKRPGGKVEKITFSINAK